MGTAPKLMALCAIATMGMAIAAGSASAQEQAVEFQQEDGTPCGTTESTGCTFQATGESHITNTSTGQQVFSCQDTLEGSIHHVASGSGQAGHIVGWHPNDHPVNSPPSCAIAECSSEGEREWDITNPGETAPNTSHMILRFCHSNGFSDVHCNAELKMTEVTPHQHQFSIDQLCAFGTRRVEGTWNQVIDAAHPAFEVDHTPGT